MASHRGTPTAAVVDAVPGLKWLFSLDRRYAARAQRAAACVRPARRAGVLLSNGWDDQQPVSRRWNGALSRFVCEWYWNLGARRPFQDCRLD